MTVQIEQGRLGRIALVRLKPNEDLIEGAEEAARQAGFKTAIVRGAVGSLVDANLGYGDKGRHEVKGPGIEILSLAGELGSNSRLQGTVADSEGRVFGGLFLRGANPICITLELTLQEWIEDET